MNATANNTELGARAGLREWTALAVLALPTLLVSIDVSVMILALPHISAGIGADSTQQLWIMDMYGFILAGFMITMGTLGDRIGRRKLLMFGAVGFGVASVLAAFSTTPLMLIGARGLLGLAGATISPSILALISNLFRDDKQRSFAIGIWLTCFMGGMTVGPLVGGFMLEHFWWGSVFLLGVPIMLLLLATAPFLLPEYKAPQSGGLDLVSVALCLGMILPVIYGLKETAKHGLEPLAAGAIVVGLTLGFAFIWRQRHLESPLLDLRLFENRPFTSAIASMFGVTFTGANMLFIAGYLQFVTGLSPLWAGIWMLPSIMVSTLSFLVAPILARRIAPGKLITGGLVIAALGAALVAISPATTGFATLIIGYICMSAGCGPIVALSTDIVMGAAPPEKAGSAASLSETSNELSFALGIATLGSLGTVLYRGAIQGQLPSGLPAEVVTAANDSLAQAFVAVAALPEPMQAAVLAVTREAYVGGMHTVATFTSVILLVAAGLAWSQFRHLKPIGSEATEPELDDHASRLEGVLAAA
jgi:DHA2 family multidrug resistance protein-like MFS transporter